MITGGCLCGAVRFRATEGPISARVCWCTVCQKIGAGGPTVGAAFRTETVTVEGPLTDYVSIADSGNRMRRSFCGDCGTHLFSESSGNLQNMVIRVGTLDDAGDIRPSVVIWTDSAPAWAHIDPSLQAFPRQPG